MAAVTRRRLDPEFRAGAVRIVRETGKPVAHVARDLGINKYTLYDWVQMDWLAAGQAGGDLALDEPPRFAVAICVFAMRR